MGLKCPIALKFLTGVWAATLPRRLLTYQNDIALYNTLSCGYETLRDLVVLLAKPWSKSTAIPRRWHSDWKFFRAKKLKIKQIISYLLWYWDVMAYPSRATAFPHFFIRDCVPTGCSWRARDAQGVVTEHRRLWFAITAIIQDDFCAISHPICATFYLIRTTFHPLRATLHPICATYKLHATYAQIISRAHRMKVACKSKVAGIG